MRAYRQKESRASLIPLSGMLVARINGVTALWALLSAIVIWPVPFVPQQKSTCAAASLAMIMRYWGQPVSSDEIAEEYLRDHEQGIRGSQLVAYARSRGMLAVAFEGDIAQLEEYVIKGRPLIVALDAGSDRFHDIVVVGIDNERHELLVHDPARGPFRRVGSQAFEKQWKKAGHWTLLVIPDGR